MFEVNRNPLKPSEPLPKAGSPNPERACQAFNRYELIKLVLMIICEFQILPTVAQFGFLTWFYPFRSVFSHIPKVKTVRIKDLWLLEYERYTTYALNQALKFCYRSKMLKFYETEKNLTPRHAMNCSFIFYLLTFSRAQRFETARRIL